MSPAPLRWAAAVSWAGTLLWLGSRPPDNLPDTGALPFGDKIAHAGAYGILGILVAWARLPVRMRSAALWGLTAALLVGGTDEWLQSMTPDRCGSLADLAADITGATAGAAIASRLIPGRKG